MVIVFYREPRDVAWFCFITMDFIEMSQKYR